MIRALRSRSAAAALAATGVVLLATGCGGGSSTAASGGGDALTWHEGMITAKGDSEFSALYAQEKGCFAKQGVDVKIDQFEGSLQLTQALLSGQIDAAENNADPVIRALAQGGKATAIGGSITGIAYDIFSKSSITSLDQLEGATVGVSKPGAFPDLITRAMMAAKGVDPSAIRLVNAGDDATRYKALVAGKVEAVGASPEFVPQAQKDGVRLLAEASKIVPQWPRFVIWANPDSLESKPKAAVAYMAGMMCGLRYAQAHKQDAIQFAAKQVHLPPSDPRLTYDYEVQSPLVSPTMDIPVDKIKFVASFLKKIGATKTDVDVDAHVDPSFREQALKKVSSGS